MSKRNKMKRQALIDSIRQLRRAIEDAFSHDTTGKLSMKHGLRIVILMEEMANQLSEESEETQEI